MKGYRTIIFNAVMAILLLLNALLGTDFIAADVAATVADSLSGLLVVGNLVLRKLTTTAMGEQT